jgi:hypothetical protein
MRASNFQVKRITMDPNGLIRQWQRLQAELQKTVEPYLEVQREAAENFARTLDMLGAQSHKAIADFAAQVARDAQPFQKEVERAAAQVKLLLEDLPEKQRKALVTLGRHGWYLDPEMVAMLPELLATALGRGGDEARSAEDALIRYFRGRVSEISEALSRQYPERKRFFDAAFAAHVRGEYCLSIPLLLAQADGISREATGGHFFRRDRKTNRPATNVFVATVMSAYRAAMLEPLRTVLPINASEGERAALAVVPLNRHEVMHGDSLDYDTEENGLRVISLVNYFAYVLRAHDDGNDDSV